MHIYYSQNHAMSVLKLASLRDNYRSIIILLTSILKKQLKRLWIKGGMECKKFINSAAIL